MTRYFFLFSGGEENLAQVLSIDMLGMISVGIRFRAQVGNATRNIICEVGRTSSGAQVGPILNQRP